MSESHITLDLVYEILSETVVSEKVILQTESNRLTQPKNSNSGVWGSLIMHFYYKER